jgi:hypothetical protein
MLFRCVASHIYIVVISTLESGDSIVVYSPRFFGV